MTYSYDKDIEQYGKISKFHKYGRDGTYITPSGTLFDVDSYAAVAHAGGFVIPFFQTYMHPDQDEINYYSKEELLSILINWEKSLLTKEYDVNYQEQQMRLDLVRYFINVYKSNKSIWDERNEYVDFSETTGIPNIEENWYGRDVTLKSVLVQFCNYDSVESQLYRSITTSKFNIYETFYDYILHDFKIFQIPKKVYNETSQQYTDYEQSIWLISDKELRLKAELESICKEVPLEERYQYCKNKSKVKNYDFY